MQINWIPTDEYYQRIVAAPDAEARQQLYLELFVQPWKAMMDMFAGMRGGADDDPLAGARAWAWLLPEQPDEIARLLRTMQDADAWTNGRQALEQAAARFAPYADRMPLEAVTGWLVLGDAARLQAFERGYTGATDWMQPRLVGQFWEANDYTLPRLGALLAHEMHHLIRLRLFPWDPVNMSVADYIVLEGTAESFAAAAFGADKVGYYITDFDTEQFETARQVIGTGLERTGFNVIRGYIFGDALAAQWGFQPQGVPTYGGYAVGYHVVQAFLRRSGLSIEEATFLPAREIVAGSGFFTA